MPVLPFRRLTLALLGALSGLAAVGAGAPEAAHAQAAQLDKGDLVATRFSGFLGYGDNPGALDLDAPVATVIGMAKPGFAPDGRHWVGEPQKLGATARDVGQVFGTAIDDAGNIYLAATSLFGLHRDADGGWAEGMWGNDGGPGTIYKLDAGNGYRPQVFATITLDGRDNTGAGLGNIAVDRWNRQLLVSDLETGMIHRLSLDDGRELGRFDHGVEGRADFDDLANATRQSLRPVPFDPDSAARLDDCDTAADSAGRLPVSCWNLADFRRRVWGLGVHREPSDGQVRVYYALAGARGFGAAFDEAPRDERRNAIWSVGLTETGAFDTEDVRREFFVPGFFVSAEDIERFGVSHPVTDIAFSGDGAMLLAERAGPYLDQAETDGVASIAQQARVLRFERRGSGAWRPAGRYDIGHADRRDAGQPFVRAGAAGGVDFAFGLTAEGTLDEDRADAMVAASGDNLCSPATPCFDPRSKAYTDASRVDGIQIMPADAYGEISPVTAYQPYPDGSGAASRAAGLDRALMIDLDVNIDAAGRPIRDRLRTPQPGHAGDVEVFRGRTGASVASARRAAPEREDEPAQPEQPAEDAADGSPADDADGEVDGLDLAVAARRLSPDCAPGDDCTFAVTVANTGTDPYSGRLWLKLGLRPALDARIVGIGPKGWTCNQVGATASCWRTLTRFAPGDDTRLELVYRLPRNADVAALKSCASIVWRHRGGGQPSVRDIQEALAAKGYNPGAIDGVPGARTRDAVQRFQADQGIRPTGIPSPRTLAALFRGAMAASGDARARNDTACSGGDAVPATATGAPEPAQQDDAPAEQADAPAEPDEPAEQSATQDDPPARATAEQAPRQADPLAEFHRKQSSDRHDRATSQAKPASGTLSPVHDSALSRYHRTDSSATHDKSTSRRFTVAPDDGAAPDETAAPQGTAPKPDPVVVEPMVKPAAKPPAPTEGSQTNAPAAGMSAHSKEMSRVVHTKIKSSVTAPRHRATQHDKTLSGFHEKFKSQAHDKNTSGIARSP